MTPIRLAGARIWTASGPSPWLDSVAVDGGRFIADAAGADGVETIDLGGRLVVPGWWDAHAHLLYTGEAMAQVQLKGIRSVADVQQRLAARIAIEPPMRWIEGAGWDQNDWTGREFPHRHDLDAVAPDHPVLLTHTSGHCAWTNSLALRLAGVTAATLAPDGGVIALDPGGEPTGILFDRAIDLVAASIPPGGPDAVSRSLRRAIDHAHSLGLVGVHAMDVEAAELAALQALRASDALDLRLRIFLSARDESLWSGHRTGDGDDWLRISGVKWFGDGALGSLTAWMEQPYEGSSDVGFPLQSVADLEASVRRALDLGLAPAIHAIGDRANREVLGVLARTAAIQPHLPRRIEHAQLLADGLVDQFAALGVTASLQPIHATQDMDKVDREWGTRGRWAYAFRDLLDAGVNLAFGSDTPVETMDPLAGIHAAVLRQRRDGTPASGWYPAQRLSVEESLAAYSHGPALATNDAGTLGCIAPGFAADCVVLSHDIITDPSAILAARVDLTMAGGKIVYARPGSGFEACLHMKG